MVRYGVAFLLAAVLGTLSSPAGAEDAKSIVAASSRAMGADGLNSITIYGVAANYQLGQSNHPGGPWPRNNLNDYRRSIDFAAPASRATAVTWSIAVTGGAAARGNYNQVIGPANQAWAQQLEIWTTPWGFLKGAETNGATATTKTVGGRKVSVVTWKTPQKAPSGKAYTVVGYIGPQHLVDRVQTWVENPVFGDMLVDTSFGDYRDANGVKYPAAIEQKEGGQPTFDAQLLGIVANPPNIAQLTAAPPRAGGGGPPGEAAPAAGGPTSEKLADGVWRINGAYNALAVEFKDYILIFEPGPQNEARSQAILAEAKRLIPGKPIRYGVISHHHFDHTSGLPAVVAEGVTIVTPAVDKPFLEKALSAPRTLAPDSMSRSGRKPKIEGFTGDERVFTDGSRTFEVHVIKGLPHADGLVIGWLPKEKILVYADMFNLPPPNMPVPDPPVVGTQVFLANLERLHIEPEKILSVHTLNPDRLTSMADIRSSLGQK